MKTSVHRDIGASNSLTTELMMDGLYQGTALVVPNRLIIIGL
jgi:hypothetical protein